MQNLPVDFSPHELVPLSLLAIWWHGLLSQRLEVITSDVLLLGAGSRQQRDQSSEYYVYLLVSEQACVFKLGHTRRLAERVQTLRGQHGAFLAADSYLVRVPSKRLAYWIETQLKMYFNDPEWRAEVPCPYPEGPCNDVGGKHEWYHLSAGAAQELARSVCVRPSAAAYV